METADNPPSMSTSGSTNRGAMITRSSSASWKKVTVLPRTLALKADAERPGMNRATTKPTAVAMSLERKMKYWLVEMLPSARYDDMAARTKTRPAIGSIRAPATVELFARRAIQ